MLSLLLETPAKRSAFQSTTILRLPTPRKPPKSITAARTLPSRSTMTSTMRPMSSSAALRTSRPSTPWASLGPMMVTEGGGVASFGVAGTAAGGGGGAPGSTLAVGISSAAREAPTAAPAANIRIRTDWAMIRILASPRLHRLVREHDRHLDLAARAQHFERD